VNYNEFLTTLLGGALAGGVGIVTAWYAQRLSNQRRLNEETLEPAFNYVHGLAANWPWLYLGNPVWREFERHRWYRIPVNVRHELIELDTRIDLHGELCKPYWELMRVKGDASFAASVRSTLAKLVQTDGQSIRGPSVGVEQNVVVQVQDLVNGVVPVVLMHPTSQADAWKLLDALGSGSYYWVKQAIRGLQKVDPSTLTKLYDAIVNDPTTPVVRPLVQQIYEAFSRVLEQAKTVREDLGPRLGLNKPSQA
jgi:hypothetical protein